LASFSSSLKISNPLSTLPLTNRQLSPTFIPLLTMPWEQLPRRGCAL
jgi:hypothetical protein